MELIQDKLHERAEVQSNHTVYLLSAYGVLHAASLALAQRVANPPPRPSLHKL